jgi:hypothetical protein
MDATCSGTASMDATSIPENMQHAAFFGVFMLVFNRAAPIKGSFFIF